MRIGVALVSSCVLLVLASCSGPVAGNGTLESRTLNTPAFDAVSAGGSAVVRVHRGASRVQVTTDANLLPLVMAEVTGTGLRLGFRPGSQVARMTKLEFDVTTPDLRGLALSGSGAANVDAFDGRAFAGKVSGSAALNGELRYDEVSLGISGSCRVGLTGNCGHLALGLSGSGFVGLSGSADRLDADVSGSGKIDGRDFAVRSARLDLSGSSGVELRIADRLEGNASGSSSVRYWGEPAVAFRASGASQVMKAGD
jgi:hypothetical protein